MPSRGGRDTSFELGQAETGADLSRPLADELPKDARGAASNHVSGSTQTRMRTSAPCHYILVHIRCSRQSVQKMPCEEGCKDGACRVVRVFRTF